MSTNENKHNQYLSISIIVLIVINIIASVLSMKTAENIEIMKVGGRKNYEKLQVIMQSDTYKQQYAQNLELMLQQLQSWGKEDTLSQQEEQLPVQETTNQNTWINNDRFSNIVTGNWTDTNEFKGE